MTTVTEKKWLFGTNRDSSIHLTKEILIQDGLLKSASHSPLVDLRPKQTHDIKAAARLREVLKYRPASANPKVKRKSKEAVVAGRKVCHPHIPIIKARMALSPYMTSPQCDYNHETLNLLDYTSLATGDAKKQLNYVGDVSQNEINKRFKEVITFQPRIHRTDYTETTQQIKTLEKYKEIPEKYVRQVVNGSNKKKTKPVSRPKLQPSAPSAADNLQTLSDHSLTYSVLSNSPEKKHDSQRNVSPEYCDDDREELFDGVSISLTRDELVDGLADILECSLDASAWNKLPALATTNGLCRSSFNPASRPKSAPGYRPLKGWPQEAKPKAVRKLLDRVV